MPFNILDHLDTVITRALLDQSAIPSLLRARTPRPDPLPSDVFVSQPIPSEGPAVDFMTIEQRVMDRVEADAPESGAQAVVNQLLAQEWERVFQLRRNAVDMIQDTTDGATLFLDSERRVHSVNDSALTLEHVREAQRRLLDNNNADLVDWQAFARSYGCNELLRPMTEEPSSLTHRQQLKRDKVGTLLPVSTNASGQVWGKDPHTGKLYHVGQTMACVKNDADDGQPFKYWREMQHARRYA